MTSHYYDDCTLFFFNDTATTEIYTLSLHDALPISTVRSRDAAVDGFVGALSALKRGDRADAGRRLVDLATLNRNRAPPEAGQERDRVPDILEQELRALLRQAGGRPPGAGPPPRGATGLRGAMPLGVG